MIYLPKSLYLQSVRVASQRKKSFSTLVREALKDYVEKPHADEFQKALTASFGIWKNRRIDGVKYVQRIRKGWGERARRLGY
jgi:hypothetical protein